jgi:hypothetical protein
MTQSGRAGHEQPWQLLGGKADAGSLTIAPANDALGRVSPFEYGCPNRVLSTNNAFKIVALWCWRAAGQQSVNIESGLVTGKALVFLLVIVTLDIWVHYRHSSGTKCLTRLPVTFDHDAELSGLRFPRDHSANRVNG